MNYDHKYEGPITLRRALEESRNIPAIKMMAELEPKNVLVYAKKFGFHRGLSLLPSSVDGARRGCDATPARVTTSACTAYSQPGRAHDAVLGVRRSWTAPAICSRKTGRSRSDVIRADTAYIMTTLLRGVVLRGTAEAAEGHMWPLAGKTGTVDDNTDAWFIGFDPDITVGVWVGFDEKKSIGSMEQGAVAALPIWMDFMKDHIDGHADKDTPPSFQAPGNIVFLSTDKTSGAEVPQGTPGSVREAFISVTQPRTAVSSPLKPDGPLRRTLTHRYRGPDVRARAERSPGGYVGRERLVQVRLEIPHVPFRVKRGRSA